MRAPENTSKPRTLCPRGPQLCRCVQVIDLGTQVFRQGEDGSRKLYLGFETSILRHTFKDEHGPEPFMLQIEFAWYVTAAGGKKTKLRTFLEKWRGSAMTDDAARAFDFAKLLGTPAMLTVAHEPKKDGGTKTAIADIYLPEKGTVVPPAVNPLVCYEIGNGEDKNFAKLPDFLKKKIRESTEFNHDHRSSGTTGTTAADTDDFAPDDLPPDDFAAADAAAETISHDDIPW